jgi:nitroreductase
VGTAYRTTTPNLKELTAMAEIGLFEAMYSARALRRFKPDPVPDEIISKILDAAIRAPTASNYQNWVFVVVKDPQRRRRVAEVYRKVGDGIRPVIANLFQRERRAEVISDDQRRKLGNAVLYLFENMHVPPVLLVACLKPVPAYWEGADVSGKILEGMKTMARFESSSIYPAVQNIILACRAFGLGTVLTTLHAVLENEVKAVLEIPKEVETWALMPIGYPLDKFGPVKRKPINEVAFQDRWGNPWQG